MPPGDGEQEFSGSRVCAEFPPRRFVLRGDRTLKSTRPVDRDTAADFTCIHLTESGARAKQDRKAVLTLIAVTNGEEHGMRLHRVMSCSSIRHEIEVAIDSF